MFKPIDSSLQCSSTPMPAIDVEEEKEVEPTATVSIPERSAEEKEEVAKVKQGVVVEEKEADEEGLKAERIANLYLEKLAWDPCIDALPFKEAAIFHLIHLYHQLEIAQRSCTPLAQEMHVLLLNLINQIHDNPHFNSQNQIAIKTFLQKLDHHLLEKADFFKEFKIQCFSIQYILSNAYFENKRVAEVRTAKKEEESSSQHLQLLSFVIKQLFVVNRLFISVMQKIQHDDLMQLADDVSFLEAQVSVARISNYIRIYQNVIIRHLKRMHQNLQQKRLDLFHLNCTRLPKAPSLLLLQQIDANIQQLEKMLSMGICLPIEKVEAIKKEEGAYIKKHKPIKELKRTEKEEQDRSRFFQALSSCELEADPDKGEIKAVRKKDVQKGKDNFDEDILGLALNGIFRNIASAMAKEKPKDVKPEMPDNELSLGYRSNYRLIVHLSSVQGAVELFDRSLQLCEEIASPLEQIHLSEEEVDALWLLNDRALSFHPKTRKEKSDKADQAPLKEKEKTSPPPSPRKEKPKEVEVKMETPAFFSSQMSALSHSFRRALHFSPSVSQELKAEGRLCLQDADYHMQVFSSSVDLYAEMKRTNKVSNWQAMMHRFVRSSSVSLEGMMTGQGLVSEMPIQLNHDFVAGTQECGYWEKLPEEVRVFLETLTVGGVFHRYPHKTARRFFTQNGRSLPKALVWLLNPKKASHRDLDPFIHAMVASFESFTHQSCPKLHKAVDRKDPPEGTQNFKQATASLRKNLKGSLGTLSTLTKESERLVTDAPTSRKTENWKEVSFILSSLQKQLNCWIEYPQPAYLISHVDMILTLLQFLDEQTGLAFYDEKFDQRFFTHDLAFYSVALNEEETDERKRVTEQLNIHTGGQYPHRYLSSLSSEEKKALDPSSAIRLRLDALHISQHTDHEGKVWTPSSGREAVSTYEEITQKLVSLVVDCLTVTKKRFNNS